MLDTHVRRYVNPLISLLAKGLLKTGLSALHVTFLAGAVGLVGALMFILELPYISLAFLWVSGVLDAVDGEMARVSNTQSDRGAMLDLFFDRLVEVAYIGAFAVTAWASMESLLMLCVTIILSICLFLSVGALSSQKGIKAFYYQAGLMERTEGFIFFSLIMLVPSFATDLVYLFALLVLVTVAQRFSEAWRLLT